jgi:trk system potassium uptake protein TrkA
VKVVIVGAGQVGSTIAADLDDTHEVVVVDRDSDRVDSLTYELDVLAVQGDGAALSTLVEADVGDADLLIASTDDDETNIVTCGTAKTMTDAFTIARVKSTKFLDTWKQSEGALGVDFMVGTNLLTAQSIVRVIGLPAATDVASFGNGVVQMAQFEINADSPLAGQTVAEADRFDSLTFAALLRPDEVVIPTGETRIHADDDVIVIGSPESVRKFAVTVDPSEDAADSVLVAGGSPIGYHVARLFGQRGLETRLVERDPERARQIAEELPEVTVFEHDPTDQDFLEREHADEVDVVVAALESDERNLLTSLLAKRVGAGRAVAIVTDEAYVPLFEAVGVNLAVNPREAVAEEITRFTREQQTANVALIGTDRAEVVEIEVDEDSVLAGHPIRDSIQDLPDGVVIGSIIRGDSLISPRGDTVIQRGDHVVVFVDEKVIDEATSQL